MRYLNYCEIKLDEIAALAILQALTLHPLVETALFQGCFQGFRTEGRALAQLVTNTRSLVLLDLVGFPFAIYIGGISCTYIVALELLSIGRSWRYRVLFRFS